MAVDITTIAVGGAQAILWFFFVQTLLRITKLEDKGNKHQTDIEVLKNNHTQVDKKVDSILIKLDDMSKNISNEFKSMSKELAEKKNRDE